MKGPEKTDVTARHVALLALYTAAPTVPFAALCAAKWAWPMWTVLVIPACVWCLAVGVIGWALVLQDRNLLWTAERALRFDLDRDSHIGRPPEKDEPRLVYVHDGGKTQRRVRRSEDFRFFLRGAFGDVGTAWRDWKSVRLPSGAVVQQEQWQAWCDRLLDAGLAERPYPTATLQLKADYLDALRAFADVL